MLFHFHRISVVGLGINILAIPLTAIITIFGFLLLPLSLLSGSLGSVYGEACLWMTNIIGWAAHISGSFQWSVLSLPRPQTILILFYICALWYIFQAPAMKNFLARIILTASMIFVLLAAKVPFAYSLVRSPDKASLLFFDVGQGDAILLNSPAGKSYFIDFGGITKKYTAIEPI